MKENSKHLATGLRGVSLALIVSYFATAVQAGLLETQSNPVQATFNPYNLSSWTSLPQYPVEPAGDATAEGYDWSYTQVAHNDDWFYIHYHNSHQFGGDRQLMYFDTDTNRTTGLPGFTGNLAVGAEYYLSGAALSRSDYSFAGWIGWNNTQDGGGEWDIFIAIDRAQLMPGVTNFFFVNQNHGSSTDDWYPNNGNSGAGGDYFQYYAPLPAQGSVTFSGRTWTTLNRTTPPAANGGQYNPPQSNSYSTPAANSGLMTGRFGLDSAMFTPISLNVGATVEYDFFITSELRNLSGNNADTWFGDTGTGFQNASGAWVTYRNMRYSDSRWEDFWTATDGGTAMTPDRYVNQSRGATQATHVKWVFDSATTATVTLTLAGDSTPYATWTNTFSHISAIRKFRVGLYDSEQDVTLANFTVNSPPAATTQHLWRVGEDSQVLPTDYVGNKPFTGGFGTRTVDTTGFAPGSTASLNFANGDGGNYMNSLSDAITVPSDNWILELWVNPTSSDFGFGVSIATLGSDSGTAQIGMVGGKWFFGEMNITYGVNNTAVAAGAWTHLAWVRDGGVNRFFVNGIQVGANTDSLVNNGRIHLFIKPGGGEVPQGNVDEIRFSTFESGQFHPGELLFNARHPAIVRADSPLAYWRLDESGGGTARDLVGGNDGNYTGTFTYGVPGALAGDANTAIEFDGASGYAVVPFSAALNPQGPFTVEAWVRPNTIPDAPGTPCPISSAQFNGNRSGWQIRERDLGWQFVLYNHSGSSVANDGLANTSHGGVPSTNSWTHLVGVYDGANTYLYVNGVAYSSSVSGYVANYEDGVNAAGPFTIGARSSLNNNFAGRVDEAAFYNRALSPTEVMSHYLDRPRLILNLSGGNITLTWPFGTLQQADDATGTYTDVAAATSPYTVPASATKKCFRVKL